METAFYRMTVKQSLGCKMQLIIEASVQKPHSAMLIIKEGVFPRTMRWRFNGIKRPPTTIMWARKLHWVFAINWATALSRALKRDLSGNAKQPSKGHPSANFGSAAATTFVRQFQFI